MSDVMSCPTCGATCRLIGKDSEGTPKLTAFSNADAENKIQQLKKSLQHLQETLRTERATSKAEILRLEAELALSRETQQAT